MDAEAKKIALRMIPYGLYVLTSEGKDGRVGAAAVTWVTQASFDPPLVAAAVRAGSLIHALVEEGGAFALNVLGKGQQAMANRFFKAGEREGDTIGGEPFRRGVTGAPILETTPAFLECRVVETVKRGDHTIFVGEVVDAGVSRRPEGRPEEATLWVRDVGEMIFYGG